MTVEIHLLDVGPEMHGDAILCRAGDATILVDGAHHQGDTDPPYERLLAQLRDLLRRPTGPIKVDLLVVSHAHEDHIGCLPELVDAGLRADWVLLTSAEDAGLDRRSVADLEGAGVDPGVLLALAEEPLPIENSDALERKLARVKMLPGLYRKMTATLGERGRVVFAGTDYGPLQQTFEGIGLTVIGPTPAMMSATQRWMDNAVREVLEFVSHERWLGQDAASQYRAIVTAAAETEVFARKARDARNMQSVVMTIGHGDERVLLTGDSQLAKSESGHEVARENIRALAHIRCCRPFGLVKLPHHGSADSFDDRVARAFGKPRVFGVITGSTSPDHPDASVLDRLVAIGADWYRTDVNGRVAITLTQGEAPKPWVERGERNDPTKPSERPAPPL